MKRYQIYEGEKTTVKQVREGQTFTINLPHGGFIKFVMGAKRQARCIGCEPDFLPYEINQLYKIRPRTFITIEL